MYILYKMSRLVSQIQFLDLKHVSLNSLSSSFMPIEHDISFPCLNAPPAFTSNSAPIVKWSWLIQFSIFFSLFFVETIKLSAPKIGPSAPARCFKPVSNQTPNLLQTHFQRTIYYTNISEVRNVQIEPKSEPKIQTCQQLT